MPITTTNELNDKPIEFSLITKYAIFKEPYKINEGWVYYFNNDIVIIKYNAYELDMSGEGDILKIHNSFRILHKGIFIYHSTILTKTQLIEIFKLINNEGIITT